MTFTCHSGIVLLPSQWCFNRQEPFFSLLHFLSLQILWLLLVGTAADISIYWCVRYSICMLALQLIMAFAYHIQYLQQIHSALSAHSSVLTAVSSSVLLHHLPETGEISMCWLSLLFKRSYESQPNICSKPLHSFSRAQIYLPAYLTIIFPIYPYTASPCPRQSPYWRCYTWWSVSLTTVKLRLENQLR